MVRLLRKLVDRRLEELGFRRISPRRYERTLPRMIHGIEFQPGTKSIKGEFTVNIYIIYLICSGRVMEGYDSCLRIGKLAATGDGWRVIDEENVLASLCDIRAYAMPHFDRLSTIEQVVHAYEGGLLSPSDLFGMDVGWQAFNLGHCYLAVGDKVRAANYLHEVINKYSDRPFEWVRERMMLAQATLCGMEKLAT